MVDRLILNFLKQDSETCIIGNVGNVPIVACWRIDDVHVAFWCPYCNELHRHGWGKGRPNGHRVEHCHNKESKFNDVGYILCCQYDFVNEDKFIGVTSW